MRATLEVPDPAWYLEHVLAAAEPDARFGAVRSRQGAWFGTAADLLAAASGTQLEAAVRLAVRQGFVLTRAQAQDCGLDEAALRRLVRRGTWSLPRRGVVSPVATPTGAAQIAAAAAALVRRRTVVSHESAAAMHGLPLLVAVRRVSLSAIETARLIDRPDIVVRGVGLRRSEITYWFGIPVTTIERTVVDLARKWGVAAGLVAADAALAEDLASKQSLRRGVEHSPRRPGVQSARRAVELACSLAESPLESLTRLCLADAKLPPPEPQVRVATAHGDFRVDLLYRGARVIVEADGELKYRQAGALRAEKRRQEALERAGWTVVRVSWRDVRTEPADVARRVRWALARDPRR